MVDPAPTDNTDNTDKTVSLFTFGGVGADRTSLHNQDQLIVLLAYLALSGESSRASLAQLFWPDADKPLNNLSSALTRLRSAAPGSVIATTKTVAADVHLDALSLRAASDAGNYALVRQLYAGEFLRGFKLNSLGVSLENWIYTQRECFAEVALRSAIEWFRSDRSARDGAAELADRAVRSVGVACLDEAEREVLYEVLEAANSPRAPDLVAEVAELGLEPATSVRDRRPSDVPPSGVLIGRDGELESLAEACEPGHVTHLWGSAGVGKTALVRDLVHRRQIITRFGDRVTHLDLGYQSSGTVLAERIAAALRLPVDVGEPLSKSVRRYVSEPRLVVIDDVGPTRSIADLLATLSSGPLGVITAGPGPMETDPILDVELGGLATRPRPGHGWTDAAILLFRCLDDLGLIFEDRHSPVAIGELARQVSGNPLAIELIAKMCGRLDAVSGSSLCLELDDEECAVNSVLEAMWELLRDDEQRGLNVLSAFSAGFGRDVAQKLARVDVGTLASLHRLGLIRADQDRVMRLNPAVRCFVQGRLDESERSAHRANVDEAMINLLTRAPVRETGPKGAHARRELGIYHHDLESAWDAVVDDRDWDRLGRVVVPYVRYLLPVHAVACHRVLGETLDALSADVSADSATHATLGAHLARGAAWAASELRQDDRARELLKRSVEGTGSQDGDSGSDALLRARLESRDARHQIALDIVEAAINDQRPYDSPRHHSWAVTTRLLMARGRLLRRLGASALALDAFRSALDVARRLRPHPLEPGIYKELAVTTASTDLDHALVLIDVGLRSCHNLHSETAELDLTATRAILLHRMGNLDESFDLAERIYSRAVAANDYRVSGIALLLKGLAASERDATIDEPRLLLEGIRIAKRCCEPDEFDEIVLFLGLEPTGIGVMPVCGS